MPTQMCQKGEVLGPEQCKLLKLFGHRMANFELHVDGVWTKKTGEFTLLTTETKKKKAGGGGGGGDAGGDAGGGGGKK